MENVWDMVSFMIKVAGLQDPSQERPKISEEGKKSEAEESFLIGLSLYPADGYIK